LSEKQIQYIKTIAQEGTRLEEPTRRIQFLTDGYASQPAPIGLYAVAQEVFGKFKSTKGINMIVDDSCKNCTVNIDPLELSQLIHEVGLNAVEAVHRKEVANLTGDEYVKISAEPCTIEAGHPGRFDPGNYTGITIEDNGVGMIEENLNRVFDLFYTTKNSSGKGLGLPIARSIAQRYGGGIAVTSETNSGTTTTIYLRQTTAETTITAPTGPRDISRILVVDDEPPIIDLMSQGLSCAGYEVLKASDGQEGWEVYQQESPDLTITDIMMPRMNGFELREKIREKDPDALVIAATGFGSDPNSDAKFSDFTYCLAKPFQLRKTVLPLIEKLKTGEPL
jgi:CheY-like chemotaxis protein